VQKDFAATFVAAGAYVSCMADYFTQNTDISQGSVATCLECGRIFNV